MSDRRTPPPEPTSPRESRTLALLERERQVLAKIAAGDPLADVLEHLVLAIEAQADDPMLASILLLSRDRRHLLHGAAPSLPDAYNEAIHGIEIGPRVGSCGTAAHRGTPVFVDDIDTDPLWADFRELALAHGLRACWSMPIKGADGRVLGTFAIYHPVPRTPSTQDVEAITFVAQTAALAIERHQSEQSLRELNETLERRVERRTRERDRVWKVSQDMILVADTNGVFLSVNPAWTTTLGWTEAELIGRNSAWLQHPDDEPRTRAEIAHLAAGGVTRRFENRLRHKDGTYRWLSWTAALDDGRIYANARDVTAEKQAAERLAATQEQLRHAQKMEALGQLTGGIAHDFNNLLMGISGALELTEKRIAQGRYDDIKTYLETARAATGRAATLTRRLLAFARRQSIASRAFDVNALVGSMEDLLARTIGERVTIATDLAPDLWPARSDANEVESALLNLVVNARDAMPEGGRVTIRTRNARLAADEAATFEVPAGDYVALEVADVGVGMTPDVLERALDPFYTTKPMGRGTGLGLSTVYGFAKQTGGHLHIESAAGVGTTVTLYLPRSETTTGGRDAAADARPAPQGSQSGRILVVEDEALVRAVILEALAGLGYQVVEAPSGEAALRILEGDADLDLLVTDVGLPGVNGRQLAERARARRPRLKVLFMTGYADDSALRSGQLAPGMDLVTKPIALDALCEKVVAMVA